MHFGVPSIGFYLALPPAILLAGDLVWEQTWLNWERGPQMVGFSLMHSGLGLLLVLALFVALAWSIFTALAAIFSRKRRNLTNIAGALVVMTAAALVVSPYGLWVRIFASRIAHGPHAVEFLVHMAAVGDISAVQALLDHGVPINERGRLGVRAIEAAGNAKQPAMAAFLAQRGGTSKRD